MAKEPSAWLGKPIVHDDHSADLETRAAIHEFKHGKSREEAELAAHADYKKEKALESAAHHYLGMMISRVASDDSSAKKHSQAYVSAMEAYGVDPTQKPPQELFDLIKTGKVKPYKYSQHQNDVLFPVPEEEPEKDKTLKSHLEKLASLKEELKKLS